MAEASRGPNKLTEDELEGRACIYCGDEFSEKQPVEASNDQGTQLVGCVDAETCARRVSQRRLMGGM